MTLSYNYTITTLVLQYRNWFCSSIRKYHCYQCTEDKRSLILSLRKKMLQLKWPITENVRDRPKGKRHFKFNVFKYSVHCTLVYSYFTVNSNVLHLYIHICFFLLNRAIQYIQVHGLPDTDKLDVNGKAIRHCSGGQIEESCG